MAQNILDNSLKENKVALEFNNGKMVMNTKDNGSKIKWMDRELFVGMMESIFSTIFNKIIESMKGNI